VIATHGELFESLLAVAPPYLQQLILGAGGERTVLTRTPAAAGNAVGSVIMLQGFRVIGLQQFYAAITAGQQPGTAL
jgi:hypothetical protein